MLWFLGGSALFFFHSVTLFLHLLSSHFSALDFLSFLVANSTSLSYFCPLCLMSKPMLHKAVTTSWQLDFERITYSSLLYPEIPGWDTADCLINVFHPLLIRCLCSLWNSPSFHFLYNKLQPTLNKYINYLLQAGNKCSYFAGADL